MQAEMTEKGLLIPAEWLIALGEFEIVREPHAIIILPLKAYDFPRQIMMPTQEKKCVSSRGKYAFVATSSEEFAKQKIQEIALENIP